MKDEYIIVDKKILPECYEKVIEARMYLAEGVYKDVSEAVKAVGISRSTYYKYKDFVFLPSDISPHRKALVSFNLVHEKGKLGEVLQVLASYDASILTITQNLPINGKAHVLVSIDLTSVKCAVEEIIRSVSLVKGTSGTQLVAVD